MDNYQDKPYSIEVYDVWANRNELCESIGIGWEAARIGFGWVQIDIDRDGNITCDTERMGNRFCNAVICALADKLFPIGEEDSGGVCE